MFGFNWIDIIIVGLLVGAVVGGIRIGFLMQIGVIASFFSVLFLGGWLWPHILPIEDRTLLTLVNANLVLIGATYAGVRGFDLGAYAHRELRKTQLRKLKPIEAWLGVIPSVAAVLIFIWLLTAMISRLPFEGFSNSTSDALIVQKLDQNLPPVPSVFATFNHVVDPNSPPQIFAEPKPQTSFNFSTGEVQQATAKAEASIVRITSFGCGGLVSGSGFAIGPNLVATNGHVVAGVKRPIVKYDNHSFEAVPVLFNANLDFAILRIQNKVHNFNAPPLKLAKESIDLNTSVAVLGYPGGDYTAVPGIIRNDLTLFGRNIYNIGFFGRDVYEVQASAEEGGSGGPIVLADGRVAGVLFRQR